MFMIYLTTILVVDRNISRFFSAILYLQGLVSMNFSILLFFNFAGLFCLKCGLKNSVGTVLAFHPGDLGFES